MIVSWAVFTMSFTLLSLSMRAVVAIGGYCAEGGPYEIATHCPDKTAYLTPLSIYMGLAAVGLGVFVTRGLGASLALFAWPVLFIGLSLNFLESGFDPQGMAIIGLILGAMFFIMGAIPVLLWGRQPGNISAALAGTSHIDGNSVGSVSFAYGRPKETTPPFPLDFIDYAVLIPLWLLAAGFGVWLALLWFYA